MLCRSREMEKVIIQASEELTHDWETKNSKFDGIIYLMFCKLSCPRITEPVLLYGGKTRTLNNWKSE